MLTASIDQFRYHRVVLRNADAERTAPLKAAYDYSFIVCYGRFDDADYSTEQKTSAHIDVTSGAEAAFDKFSQTCRNEIRKTVRDPNVHVGHWDRGPEDLYAFHEACERERGWLPVPLSEFCGSCVFACFTDDLPLAGISCYGGDGILRVGRIFSRRRSEELADVYRQRRWLFSAATRRVVYEACIYAARQGFEFLDLGGIDPSDSSKSGIFKFKQSFGPAHVPATIARYRSEAFLQNLEAFRKSGVDIT